VLAPLFPKGTKTVPFRKQGPGNDYIIGSLGSSVAYHSQVDKSVPVDASQSESYGPHRTVPSAGVRSKVATRCGTEDMTQLTTVYASDCRHQALSCRLRD